MSRFADECLESRRNGFSPLAAVEDTVVANSLLQVVQTPRIRNIHAQVMSGPGLSGAGNVVLLALDRHQCGLFDSGGIHFSAVAEWLHWVAQGVEA